MLYLVSVCARREQEEHDLEFTELFEEYLQLFESTLEKFIEREGSDVQEFYSQVIKSPINGHLFPVAYKV